MFPSFIKNNFFLIILLLINFCIVSLLVTWVFSKQPYEAVNDLYLGEQWIIKLEKSDPIAFEAYFSEKYKVYYYLYKAKTSAKGWDILMYIKKAIKSAPDNQTSFEIIANMIEQVPPEQNLAKYLNSLYTRNTELLSPLADLCNQRYQQLKNNKELQQEFYRHLESDLQEKIIL